jgi:hypothetical protein
MSTSNEHDSGFETTVGEDRLYVINHVTLKSTYNRLVVVQRTNECQVIQASSIVVPPVWAAVSLIRGRPLTVSGLLRCVSKFGLHSCTFADRPLHHEGLRQETYLSGELLALWWVLVDYGMNLDMRSKIVHFDSERVHLR